MGLSTGQHCGGGEQGQLVATSLVVLNFQALHSGVKARLCPSCMAGAGPGLVRYDGEGRSMGLNPAPHLWARWAGASRLGVVERWVLGVFFSAYISCGIFVCKLPK